MRDERIRMLISVYIEESNLIELLNKDKNQELPYKNLLNSIAENMTIINLDRDQTLFRINDPADFFYFILKGRISVLKPVKKYFIMSYKNFYLKMLELIKFNDTYLFKMNIKANSDIFFSSPEEFENYGKILIKMKIKEILFNSDYSPEELLFHIKTEEFNHLDFNLPEDLDIYYQQNKTNFNFLIRKIFEITMDDNEVFTKFNTLININFERRQFYLYVYENFTELRTKQFFGDFGLDSPTKKRSATIVGCEESILGLIPSDIYLKYIYSEKVKFRSKDIILLNNYIMFKHIKQIHFEKNYFQDFAPFEYVKDEILFKQGEIVEKLFIIKTGNIDLYLHANLVDINLIIKNLILKAKDLNLFSQAQSTEYMDKFYDGLNAKNKSSSYFANLVKKKKFLLFTVNPGDSCGIESIFLNIPYLFKGVVKSNSCKLFKLDIDKMNQIVKGYENSKKDFVDLLQKKINVLINRLFNIKQCLVGVFTNEYENQTKIDKINRDKNSEINENQEVIEEELKDPSNFRRDEAENNKNNFNIKIDKKKIYSKKKMI